jgi:uncharacterized membrane protein
MRGIFFLLILVCRRSYGLIPQIPQARHKDLAAAAPLLLGFFAPYSTGRNRSDRNPIERVNPVVVGTSHRVATRLQSSFLRPLIRADDTWGNWAALCGLAAGSQVLGHRTAVGRLLGPPVTAMALSFAAATLGVINPGGTAAAKSLQLLSLQLATPLILLGADLRDAASRCGPLIISFAVAALATIIACLVGWTLCGSALTTALGPHDALVIAAALLAKNVGGGINYLAVCRSLNASPAAVAAGICVDNLFALAYFPTTSALANGRPDVIVNDRADTTIQKSRANGEAMNSEAQLSSSSNNHDFSVQQISTVLFLSAALLWLGEKVGGDSGGLPLCTVFSVLLASLAPVRWMRPLRSSAHSLGLVALYVFFATAGAPGIAVAESVQASLVPVGLYLTCLYSIHGAILFVAHKVLGRHRRFGAAFQPQRLLVSSSAAIGGPATAVALATAANWQSLEVPSIVVGNIGYAIATFCGLAFHALFR